MATVREITLTQSDVTSIEDRGSDILLKFRKKRVMKGVRMYFKFALQKYKLQEWYGQTSALLSSNPMLLGADSNSGIEYEDVDIYYEEGDSEVSTTETINVYFHDRPFINELTITVTMIIQKTTIRDWYDTYIGGHTVYQLNIRPTSVTLSDGNAGSANFTVEANTPWSLTTNSTWILGITPDSGTGDADITVIVDANTTSLQRTAFLTLNATSVSTQSKTVTIRQPSNSSGGALTINPTEINAAASGGNVTIYVNSNVDWEVISTATQVCTVSPATGSNNGTVTVTIPQNTSTNTRNASIVFSKAGGTTMAQCRGGGVI